MSSLSSTSGFAHGRAAVLNRVRDSRALLWGKLALVCAAVSLSAIVVKDLSVRSGSPAPLAVTQGTWPMFARSHTAMPPRIQIIAQPEDLAALARPVTFVGLPEVAIDQAVVDAGPAPSFDGLLEPGTRFFNGRPVRVAKTMTMLVTAYSPDPRSCGHSADGITASLHAVETNAFRLVAADSTVLPLGSIISLDDYDGGNLVPVLDRGGAIKGQRLDVLFPTHEQAMQFGVKRVEVTVWEYADGEGNDWRKIRDSKK